LFDSSWYLSEYADVATLGLNPLVHYLQRGVEEGRLPLPPTTSCNIDNEEDGAQSRTDLSGKTVESVDIRAFVPEQAKSAKLYGSPLA
jgi:hypothetical protein